MSPLHGSLPRRVKPSRVSSDRHRNPRIRNGANHLLIARVLVEFDLRLFHLVDGLVGLFEALQVGGAEIFRLRDLGDLLERGLVDFAAALHEAENPAAARLVGARADGIDLDAEGGGGLRGVLRGEAARVVDAVGKEDHDLGLGLGIAQAIDAGGDGVADGRGVFEHAGLQAVHLEHQPGVVGGQRRDGVGHRGEGDDPHAVVGPRLDELREDGLGRIEAVHALGRGGEVVGAHGGGGVHEQNDVHALGFDARFAHALLRTGGGDDEEDEPGGQEGRRKFAQDQPGRARQTQQRGAVGECQRRVAAAGMAQPNGDRHQQQKQKHQRMAQGHHASPPERPSWLCAMGEGAWPGSPWPCATGEGVWLGPPWPCAMGEEGG